jgi:hypothetical protein
MESEGYPQGVWGRGEQELFTSMCHHLVPAVPEAQVIPALLVFCFLFLQTATSDLSVSCNPK